MLIDYNNLGQFMDTKNLALDKSARPKNSLITTFALIIDKIRLIRLQLFYLDTLSGMPKKKLFYELKTPRSCTSCNSL